MARHQGPVATCHACRPDGTDTIAAIRALAESGDWMLSARVLRILNLLDGDNE